MLILTRRSALQGMACLCAVCYPLRAPAEMIIEDVLCATQSPSGLRVDKLLTTSGDRDLDKQLTAEMNKQSSFFGYRPAFVLYFGEKNAAATKQTLPDYPQTNGTIFYNLDMLREQLAVSQWGGTILAGVIAHEFGHIYQQFTGYWDQLRALDSTVKFIELHADFLSGFYMAGKDRSIPIKDYTDAFYKTGDYGFTDATHHGTPQERYLALKAGFNSRLSNKYTSLNDAAKNAVAFLNEYIH